MSTQINFHKDVKIVLRAFEDMGNLFLHVSDELYDLDINLVIAPDVTKICLEKIKWREAEILFLFAYDKSW